MAITIISKTRTRSAKQLDNEFRIITKAQNERWQYKMSGDGGKNTGSEREKNVFFSREFLRGQKIRFR